MKLITTFALIIAAAAIGSAIFIYSGVYNIGADIPHTRLIYRALETLRERSIARHAADISVPTLDGAEQLLSGGADYAEMCAGCHLQPGSKESEINTGLYPQPPNLSEPSDLSAAEMFWVVKHGVKMTAMAAWGPTHDDQRIWAMVAFIKRLPELTPAQYEAMTAPADGKSSHHHLESPSIDAAQDNHATE